MRALHVIGGISRSNGGPSRSSQGLVSALCKAGVDAWIYPFDGSEPWISGVRKYEIGVGDRCRFTAELKRFDLVHIHGIWDLRLHKVAVMCRKAGVPYVIAPRGMLEPWSLKQKWLKKRIARFLYQDRDLRLAAALHATAESEAEQFRALGFKNKIIISPNGVNVPEGDVGLGRDRAQRDSRRPTPRSTVESANSSVVGRRALFVSRMHPKKGVLELVESWARLKHSNNPNIRPIEQWSCELVYTMNSAEERAYEQKVKDRILSLGMTYQDKDGTIHSTTTTSNYDFILTGPLDDEKKWDAYARADLFVLPTYSENFGIVVAEALWAGVPVITTKGTPWKELEERKCGWWIDLPKSKSGVEVEQWAALDFALREAIEHSNNPNNRTFLPDMGHRGHQLVSDRYTWSAVCDKMLQGYEEVLK